MRSQDDFQRLLQKSFTVQASSASDSLLSITAQSRSRLYRPEQTVAERDTHVSIDRTLQQELSRVQPPPSRPRQQDTLRLSAQQP